MTEVTGVTPEMITEWQDLRRGVPDEVVLNDRSCYTVKEAGRWLVEIAPMIFNFRVVLTPKTNLLTYEHGWCYIGRGEVTFARAWLAAAAFDPTVQLDPPGFDKQATPPRRHVDD